MNYRALYILAGLTTIFTGYITYKDSWWYLQGFKVPRSVGVMLISFGCILMAVGIFKKKMISAYDTIMKCPECLKVYRETEAINNKCPNCGYELEPLEGFFERHPSIKKRAENEKNGEI